MKKKVVKNLFKLFLLVLSICYIVHVSAYSIPSRFIENNVIKSIKLLNALEIRENPVVTMNGQMFDTHTDTLMLHIAVFNDNQVINAFENNYYINSKYEINRIDYLLSKNNIKKYNKVEYSRYWHGYISYLKPLLCFFDLSDIRYILLFVHFIMMILIIKKLSELKMFKYTFIYGFCVISMGPFAMLISLQYFSSFFMMNLGILLVLNFYNKPEKIIYSFLVIGMLVNYIDFLTYPSISLGIPLVFYFLLNMNMSLKEKIKHFFYNSVSWSLGYFFMWLSKWIISSVILNRNVFKIALSNMKKRSFVASSDVLNDYYYIVKENYGVYNKFILYAFIILVIFSIISMIYNKIHIKKILKDIVIFLMIAIIPFIWYFVFLAHSEVHSFFTYRTGIITIFSCFSFLLYYIDLNCIKKKY